MIIKMWNAVVGQCSREGLVGYMTWLFVMLHPLVIDSSYVRLDLLKYRKTSEL